LIQMLPFSPKEMCLPCALQSDVRVCSESLYFKIRCSSAVTARATFLV